MGTVEEQQYCPSCERHTVHHVEKPDRMVHFALAVISAGAWFLVWFAIELFGRRKSTCAKCGVGRQVKGVSVDEFEGGGIGRSSRGGGVQIRCRKCNEKVAKEAEQCPHCGVANPTDWP